MAKPLTPSDIERLLYQTAARRNCTVTELHDTLNDVSDAAGISFEQCLQFVAAIDQGISTFSPRFVAEYQMYQEEAARLGCTMDQLIKAYSRIKT